MWRLEHMQMIWWLLSIPLVFLMVYLLARRKELKWGQMGNPARIRSLLHDPSTVYRGYRKALWTAAILLLIMAMANLQMGAETERVSNKGSNVIIALDLSNSMLAQDVAPDRLERARNFISRLVGQLGGDRVALIVFAGRAYLQLPFTTDYSAVELQLRSVGTDMMPTQGTALGEAIDLAMNMPAAAGQKEKVLVLLSDGEDHDSKAISLARKASGKGLSIYTIGVGTEKGGYIPELVDRGQVLYKMDRDGNVVLSRLNEDNLRKIANAGGGQYFNIANERKAIRDIGKAIRWSGGSEGEERIYTRYKSHFQWFLLPAILLLMLEMLLYQGWRDRRVAMDAAKSLVLFILGSSMISCRQPVDRKWEQGYSLFEEGRYQEAGTAFRELALRDTAFQHAALFNLSSALQAGGQSDSALFYLDSLLGKSPDTSLAHRCYFNKGNILFSQRNFQEAARMYEQALKLRPGHYRSQYNLSLALEHILPLPEPNPPPQDKDDTEKQQDQDNQQDQKDKKGQQDKEQDNQRDQKTDNGNKDEGKDKGKENQPKEPEKPKDQDKGTPPKPGSQRINAADMERLFQQLDREEKSVQRRIYQQSGENSYKPSVEKDW